LREDSKLFGITNQVGAIPVRQEVQIVMFVKSLLQSFTLRRRAAAVLCLTVLMALGTSSSAARPEKEQPIVFTVDVAEDLAGKFVPTFVKPEHTQPERGSFFVTEGRIFPAGTITGDGATFDPNRSGHVGVWFCRGTHLVSASEIPAAPLWVNSAQLFILGRQGKEQISTEGVEGGGTIVRIVTGGAGNYTGFVGEQRQTFLGFNPTGGVNLRVTFTLRKVTE
jgi:hypothetical protein